MQPQQRSLPVYLTDPLFSCYVPSKLVEQNSFRTLPPSTPPLPRFAESRALLPHPTWDGHDLEIACYWRAWELAFGNLGQPTEKNGFVAPYIDTAFNGHLFLWDSVIILMFGRYGSRAFDFQRTLDNMYAKQHPDGFICREIDIADGQDCFHRHDPSSTGPNMFGWSEWEYFQNFGDRDRLASTFPVLLAYHRWMRDYRTWPDGTYWSTGWACGMDNQPRVPAGYSPALSPAHQSWMDANLQAIFSARLLLRIAKALGETQDVSDLTAEVDHLTHIMNERMWDDREAFYYDLRRDGQRIGVKTVGAYWALLADVVPADRLERFIAHLENKEEFNRPHRVPSLAANVEGYDPGGGYWLGSIWPPTQYIVLRGLTSCGRDRLAHDIGMNHVQQVAEVFGKTGTLWENYAPESANPGNNSRPDFVGWGGLGPIAVMFEYCFGLRPQGQHRLVWDVRLLDAHGVSNYPIGATGKLNLSCPKRARPTDRPDVSITSNVPLDVELRWNGGNDILTIQPNG